MRFNRILPKKLDEKVVKRVFLTSKISSWWNPENFDAVRNPLLAFRDMYVKERRDIVEFLKDKMFELSNILEVGCGSGRITLSVVKEFRRECRYLNYVSIDISGEMLRILNKVKSSIYRWCSTFIS